MDYKKCALLDFWKNVKFHEEVSFTKKQKEGKKSYCLITKRKNTYIAEPDYKILADAGLLVSEEEYKKDEEGTKTKLHQNLPPEPFVGNLMDAKIYVVSLNPHAGDHDFEYTNWGSANLLVAWGKNLAQIEKNYPFYYLNPDLEKTGGGRYWVYPVDGDLGQYHKFDVLITKLANEYFNGDYEQARKLVAQNVCDIELCPYHSVSWENNEIINTLPSVKATIDFLINHIIPDVISGKKALVVLRHVSEIKKLLSQTLFDYNGKNIYFDENFAKMFNDRVCMLKGNYALVASLNPDIAKPNNAGEIIYNQLVKLIKTTK